MYIWNNDNCVCFYDVSFNTFDLTLSSKQLSSWNDFIENGQSFCFRMNHRGKWIVGKTEKSKETSGSRFSTFFQRGGYVEWAVQGSSHDGYNLYFCVPLKLTISFKWFKLKWKWSNEGLGNWKIRITVVGGMSCCVKWLPRQHLFIHYVHYEHNA